MGLIDTLWNAFAWSHDRSSHLVVKVRTGFFTYGPPNPHLSDPMVIVKAINRSQHPLRLTNVGLQADSRPDGTFWNMTPHPLSKIPGSVAPMDAIEAYLPAEQFSQQGVDFTKPVRAVVALADDTLVWSSPTKLWKDDLLAA